MDHIRNFCIIAHIDHGKSTLADRMLEYTKTIQVTEGQMLDDMDLERERGITIKSHAIQMEYDYKGEKYILNLIDTPGHVDFSYEVSRSIAACEGALLVVDATQGVQAQTISNLYMAIDHNLEIIPVINKIDMPSAMPDEVEDEIIDLIGCDRKDIIRASGKTGEGVDQILDAVVERIPCPEGAPEAPLQALIFDSVFNSFRGIIAYFKITNGVVRKGDMVSMERKGDRVHLEFVIPSRGIIGLRTNVLTATAGEAVIAHRFLEYQPYKGDIERRTNGALIAMESGTAFAYALDKLQDRGRFFINPQDEVYAGQVVGEHCKDNDIVVNVTKSKQLTNMRSKSSDEKARIIPPIIFSLEEALEYIREDEYVEVTPNSMRLRKIILDETERKRANRG